MDVEMVSACGKRPTKHMASSGYCARDVQEAELVVAWAVERCPS